MALLTFLLDFSMPLGEIAPLQQLLCITSDHAVHWTLLSLKMSVRSSLMASIRAGVLYAVRSFPPACTTIRCIVLLRAASKAIPLSCSHLIPLLPIHLIFMCCFGKPIC
ncbi:hypothetical protein XENTR_v10000847 [Xenopus tropicalis]|nr:hypothetical protein XENTR_v10000847 [Xenopus tropicalis]